MTGYTEALHKGVYEAKQAHYICTNEADRCRNDLYDKCRGAEAEAEKAAYAKASITELEFMNAYLCAFEALGRAGDFRDEREVAYQELEKAEECGYTETLHEETVAALKAKIQCFGDDEECTLEEMALLKECEEGNQKALADTFNAANITAEQWANIDSCAFETISTLKG